MAKKKVLTYKGAVATWECDSNGHMNVMYYINKYELAGRNFFIESGITKKFMQAHNLGIAVVEQVVKYQKEVFEDDILYIESTVTALDNKVMTFFHVLKDGATHEVSGSMIAKTVLFDKTKRKAIPVPENIKNKLAEFL